MHIYNEKEEDVDTQIREFVGNSVDKMRKNMAKKSP